MGSGDSTLVKEKDYLHTSPTPKGNGKKSHEASHLPKAQLPKECYSLSDF